MNSTKGQTSKRTIGIVFIQREFIFGKKYLLSGTLTDKHLSSKWPA
jgi:hypothetical protein